ncbi:hypothetical protein [Actinoplanes auranticolor]|uniref:Uncharacterized protein n=1 Tax=Actinoplanes auranticolor TaxID=47988 RepID=A0A919VSJ8_9ACTN|nr:hypothetical protein [Actinoplanes auranticolor]GIM74277.1 hypothetical protein Aau02nite_60190 [Actinoplanes auranticolor]
MDRQPETTDPAALLVPARDLRTAAVIAGRADVVAKVDEVILLIAGRVEPAGTERDGDKANTVVRILDGLGF